MKQILIRYSRCVGCKSCELACSVAHSEAGSLFGAVVAGERPIRRVEVEGTTDRSIILPMQCRQCKDPQCVKACMTGAMSTDEATGMVKVFEERCVGCFMCAMVCPYGSIKEGSGKAIKCDLCEKNSPACVEACPTKALEYVEVDEFDKKVRGDFLTKFACEKEG